MQKEIFVTGLGIISAIGNNVAENLNSLKSKKTGIALPKILTTKHNNEFMLGEVSMSNTQLMQYLSLDINTYSKYTRTALLGLIAAKEALIDSEIDLNDGLKTGLISATTVGGMDKTEIDLADSNASNDFIFTHACGDSTNKICDELGITGYRTTISTACSSGTNAIIHGIRLIQAGIIDRAIVGGVDSLSKFTLNGFNSLMILDKEFCRPFDETRAGLNLGEGAGFIVIESEKSLQARGKIPICKVSGWANANDAYHQTASSPEGEGAFNAMTDALTMSGLALSEIDYINVHGTGTNNNDLSEGVAMKRVFGDSVPTFSSTKSYTGHTLGAAAGVEAVFSSLSILHGIKYPNLNFKNTITEIGISPITEVEEAPVRNVISNSFGFGGNNSSIIFSK